MHAGMQLGVNEHLDLGLQPEAALQLCLPHPNASTVVGRLSRLVISFVDHMN